MPEFSADDQRFMQRALRLARRGLGRVEPNPMVGCVLVRGGRVIGEGYHHKFGGAHAEVEALRRCESSPRGATAYVTLEPCCYHGKTPACTDALLAAGVKRVVAAMTDPNPRVSGKGLKLLRKAGVQVATGLCEDEARALNAPFVKLVTLGRPWVILKWAQSLDGKIATRTFDSKWISDEKCRRHAHRTRGRVDAVMVGVETVRRDDPQLTCRAGRPKRVATRIVLDSQLRTPTQSKLVQTAAQQPTWIFHDKQAAGKRVKTLEEAGCRLSAVPRTRMGLSLAAVLRVLGRAEMTNVLVEGGGRLLGRFFDAKLGDEVHAYIAPRLIGGAEAIGALHGVGSARVAQGARFEPAPAFKKLGDGWLLTGRVRT